MTRDKWFCRDVWYVRKGEYFYSGVEKKERKKKKKEKIWNKRNENWISMRNKFGEMTFDVDSIPFSLHQREIQTLTTYIRHGLKTYPARDVYLNLKFHGIQTVTPHGIL